MGVLLSPVFVVACGDVEAGRLTRGDVRVPGLFWVISETGLAFGAVMGKA